MINKRYITTTTTTALKTVPKFYGSQFSKFKYSKTIPTHEVLTKLGLIQYPRAGLVNWGPMGLTIMNKISDIIRTRMNEIGFEELSLSLLSHRTLWEKTGRWSSGGELFKLNNDEYLLAPTAEEEITEYVNRNLSSYKELPVLLYQINPKFRDEKRPRGGLLRGKEFLMKDAYSFDISEAKAMESYEKVVGAYHKIFQDLKLPYIKAAADSGDIGGSLSHEWHCIDKTGEDTVFTCDSCHHVSNVEKTLSYPESVDETQSGEVSVRYFMTEDKSTLVCAYYPTSRTLEPKFVKQELPDIDLKISNQEEILQEFSNEETLISKHIIRVMDSRLHSRSNFPDFPIKFINRSLMTTLTDIPMVLAEEGEICGMCEDGTLTSKHAIELGHTFYLGDKYSKPLSCKISAPNEDGRMDQKQIMMGCYGIGISRIIATAAEIYRDDVGLVWPSTLAPWQVTVVEVGKENQEKFGDFFEVLNKQGIDYRYDNRDSVSFGKKIRESNTLGIPLCVILGKQYPMVEIEIRGKRLLGEDQKWKQSFEAYKDKIEWEVKYDDKGNDIKHIVHKDGLVTVVNSLLQDM
ncbi:PRS [[Candida] subhashii]|uniref:PRS n=1 Tax=[Candida] subhashii TaxID=561895 RepID=A0A8J5UUQ9_9ASCO|nr:PRS [[Candida] subhashii]KAG7661820.1 PRS [[Candida] subhashii]